MTYIDLPPASAAAARRSNTTTLVLAIIGFIVLGFVFLAVSGYLVLGLGPAAFVISGILALLPLAVVVGAITLIDRWEPEPRPALWFAFLWGAAASVAIALIADFSVQVIVLVASDGTATTSELWGSVIQAPVVEESAKAAGILILLLFFRRQFDGPVDGLVYGATVAAGFAFTENILYFGQALIESGGVGLGFTFLLRGIMSPFAHVMFTACTGVALGFAVRGRFWRGALIFVAGLALAIGLHALWNGSTFIVEGIEGFFLLYFVVQVPLFALAIVFVVLLRRAETRLTRARLEEYAAAGWFSEQEVELLSTGAGRAQALRFAKGFPGGTGGPAMRSFIRTATRLAFTRQRMLSGRGSIGRAHPAEQDEAALLEQLAADRRALAIALPANR
ncbi:PrsW family intramembrane metalloprotease [Herbiconiux sp. CPCC 203407]|uniref:PrsW family intramembrane metalloprotease n=1 Tax=Herbiconiux oxytropis TaxID=2970915 RepID=A0AA41XGP7_9MICO|nr:PrsW family intramembrane metalloprotease [Herbiconiux oxytropis]MCS5720560.1 PrsW family intramembrane metalloprotease [Herbiconiux oxytropis]MCS5726133.1 PrsW family intramembrane metalloprotease [Herbiconiux oxytropis]